MKFGLIGDQVSHSFSKDYFSEKFANLGLDDFSYDLLSVPDAEAISEILKEDYFGLNVTKPYKSEIIPLLNEIDTDAFAIGAVNTLVRTGQYSWKGFNTDQMGFEQSLLTWLSIYDLPKKAMVLGSGGASKAVHFVLARLGVQVSLVSSGRHGDYAYEDLTDDIIQRHPLIINTTPLGMAPNTSSYPQIPYNALTSKHWVYDLVYNPANTVFLMKSKAAGACVKNGLEMLYLQADYAWSIWKSYVKF
jgi:shikimate dehydrogenase